jgi:RHS repeat-associated protein
VQGTATQFLYDGANAVQETQGSTINPILVGLNIDERFARNDVIGRTYFLTDQLDSTIALTDPTGAIQQQYSCDPYSNVTASNTTTGFTNPYQYTGREADTAGLYYYRARYYSPMMAGFISEDPIGFGGGQDSFYAYVGGDPLDYIDAFGFKPGDPFPTAAPAALDALKYINPISIAKNAEYAGLIYFSGGHFYATNPVEGTLDSSAPWNSVAKQALLNAGGVPVGDYHTHGDYTDDNGNPAAKENSSYDDDHFSPTDETNSKGWAQMVSNVYGSNSQYESYLGTPSGQFYQYNSSTGVVSPLK